MDDLYDVAVAGEAAASVVVRLAALPKEFPAGVAPCPGQLELSLPFRRTG